MYYYVQIFYDLQSIPPSQATLDRSVIPFRSSIPVPENKCNEKSSTNKETLHTNSSVHSSSIEWGILGTEDGTKVRNM